MKTARQILKEISGRLLLKDIECITPEIAIEAMEKYEKQSSKFYGYMVGFCIFVILMLCVCLKNSNEENRILRTDTLSKHVQLEKDILIIDSLKNHVDSVKYWHWYNKQELDIFDKIQRDKKHRVKFDL